MPRPLAVRFDLPTKSLKKASLVRALLYQRPLCAGSPLPSPPLRESICWEMASPLPSLWRLALYSSEHDREILSQHFIGKCFFYLEPPPKFSSLFLQFFNRSDGLSPEKASLKLFRYMNFLPSLFPVLRGFFLPLPNGREGLRSFFFPLSSPLFAIPLRFFLVAPALPVSFHPLFSFRHQYTQT